jgi:DNA modification methylase
VVLDPFAGVGTTAVACQQLGRACLSCEVDETYVKIGQERLYAEARTHQLALMEAA